MNSSITLGHGSGITLAEPPRRACTDVLIYAADTAVDWTGGIDPWSLPVGEKTIMDHLRSAFRPSSRPKFLICTDKPDRGSAGSLKDFRSSLGGGTTLLIDGVAWLNDDVEWMLRQHRVSQNVLTVFCASMPVSLRGDLLRNIEPVSVYCCEPEVLEYIADTGTQDIAAHLIPKLQREGLRVGVVTLRGATREVCDWESYLTVVADALKKDQSDDCESYEQMPHGVWRHKSAQIAPSARIVGPVFIDRNCTIGAGAVIVGPTILGPGCTVEARARIVRTVATGGHDFPIRPIISDRLLASRSRNGVIKETPPADSVTERDTVADGHASQLVGAHEVSGRAAWLAMLMLAGMFALALSGRAAIVWQAWTQAGLSAAG